MANKELDKPGTIVKKDNQLIRTRVTIQGVDAHRILAQLISCIHTKDTKLEDRYQVAVKDFLNVPGGAPYIRIKGICQELAQAIAELEEPDPKSRSGYHYKACPFFSEIDYQQGIISALFNPRLAPVLLQLREKFTTYSLPEFLSLPSIYSQRIFEILQSWKGKQEVTILVTALHKWLDTPKSLRSNFKDFRNRVLEKAHQDITNRTKLKYRWEPIKSGRSVEAIRFIFKEKKLERLPSEIDQENERLKEEKDKRIRAQRYFKALKCAVAKQGNCRKMDNQRVVCKICNKDQICNKKDIQDWGVIVEAQERLDQIKKSTPKGKNQRLQN